MPSIILAKKRPGKNVYQTLLGHTEDALIVLATYLKGHRKTLEKLVEEQGFSFREFCQVLFLALFLHDLGKATREFQERLVREELSRELSHTFFSLPLVETELPTEQNLLVKVLVLTHHTQPFDELYYIFDPLPRVNYMVEEIKDYLGMCPMLHKRYFKDIFPLHARPFLLPDHLERPNLREELRQEVTRLHQEIKGNWPRLRLKTLYCLAATILKLCDSQASRVFLKADLEEGTICGTLLTVETVEGENADSLPTTGPFYQSVAFKTAPGSFQRPLLLLLPPGRQRASAALAKAVSLARKTQREKLVWITPAQLASGFVYAELSRLLGPTQVKIVHAPSYFAQDPYAWGIPPENGARRGNSDAGQRAHIFSSPVTVATLDHLVFSLVHGFRYSDYALGNLLKSVVVIDGLPAPGSPALSYALDALSLLRKMNIPHLVIEGPVAPSLKVLLKEAGYKVIEQWKFFLVPFLEVKLYHGSLVQAIREGYKLFPRQVVFVRDAFEATRLVRELLNFLPQKSLIPYHSLFNYRDRSRREKQILSLPKREGPWVLVTDGSLDPAYLPECDAVHTKEAGATTLVRWCSPLRERGYLVVHFQDGESNIKALGLKNGTTNLASLEAALEEEFIAKQPGPTNLEEVFSACTLSGPSPREVRYSPQALVSLWPYPERLMDVLPLRFWRDGVAESPLHLCQLCLKLPVVWYEQKLSWFSAVEGMAGKIILCHLPYRPQSGLDIPKLTAK